MDLSSFLKAKMGYPAPNRSTLQYPGLPDPSQPAPTAMTTQEPYLINGMAPELLMNPSGYPSISPVMSTDTGSYVKEMLQVDNHLDYLYHQLRGDILTDDGQGHRHWEPNQLQPGTPGGPIATEQGIRIILSKVMPFLNKFAAHAALTVEQAHGYAYEAASEVAYFCVLEGEGYKILRHKWSQIILLVDATCYLNLTRTINAFEANRLSNMHHGQEVTMMGSMGEGVPDFVRKFPGGL